MSPSVASAHSQWLAQLAAMREAIAELKLDQASGDAQAYGHDIEVDDNDFSGSSGSDDIWDVSSEGEDVEYSSDHLEGTEPDRLNGYVEAYGYGPAWLRSKCVTFASRRSGLDGEELEEQLLALLASDSKGILRVHQSQEGCRLTELQTRSCKCLLPT